MVLGTLQDTVLQRWWPVMTDLRCLCMYIAVVKPRLSEDTHAAVVGIAMHVGERTAAGSVRACRAIFSVYCRSVKACGLYRHVLCVHVATEHL